MDAEFPETFGRWRSKIGIVKSALCGGVIIDGGDFVLAKRRERIAASRVVSICRSFCVTDDSVERSRVLVFKGPFPFPSSNP